MQPQTEFLEQVCRTVDSFGLPYACTVGPLPEHGGISVELTQGDTQTYLNRQECHRLTLLFLCKHKTRKQPWIWRRPYETAFPVRSVILEERRLIGSVWRPESCNGTATRGDISMRLQPKLYFIFRR